MRGQVDFYLLASAEPAAKFKLACRIVLKAYMQGLKVLVRVDEPAAGEQLDTLLWTFSQAHFIPHTIAEAAPNNWLDYPVQLTICSPPDCAAWREAALLLNLVAEVPTALPPFARIADIVTAVAADKTAGRARFRFYREHVAEPKMHTIQ